MPYENFLINEPKRLRKNRIKKGFRHSSKKMRRNFLGEELMIFGNPREKRRKVSLLSRFLKTPKKWHKRVGKFHHNIAMGFHDSSGIFHPIRAFEDYSPKRAGEKKTKKGGDKMAKRKKSKKSFHRNEPKRRKIRASFHRNEPKRRKIRASFHRNEPKRRKIRASFHRNEPAVMGGAVSITKPQTLLPYFLTGAASAIVTAKVPSLIGAGDSPLWRYGSQALTAIGGGWLVSRFVGRQHGFVWAAVGGSIIVADLLSKYVLTQVGISGLGEDLTEMEGYPYAEVGYYPYSNMEGYPYAEVGAYPYEYA